MPNKKYILIESIIFLVLLSLSVSAASTSFSNTFISQPSTSYTLNTSNVQSLNIQVYNSSYLIFNGLNNSVNFTTTSNLSANQTNAMTITGWIYVPDFGIRGSGASTGSRFVIAKAAAGNYEWAVHISNSTSTVSNDTYFVMYQPDGSTFCSRSSGFPMAPNKWYFFTANYNGTSCNIYRNGTYLATVSKNAGTNQNITNATVKLGTSAYLANEWFNGSIDDIRWYNYTLSNNNILRLYQESPLGNNWGKSFPALSYHHVENDMTNNINVNISEFTKQMAYLKNNGYTTITYQNYLDWRNGAYALPAKPVIIVFDDGYMDVITNATPIMDANGQIGVIGVITESVGTTTTYMNWTNLSTLYNKGWQIVSHSINASVLQGMDNTTLDLVLSRSKAEILGNLSISTNMFIYPSNSRNDTTDDRCARIYTICSGESGNLDTNSYFVYAVSNLTFGNSTIPLRRQIVKNDTTMTNFTMGIEYGLESLNIQMNEQNGSILYDGSVNGYRGNITNGTWANDGVFNTLVLIRDYTLTSNRVAIVNGQYYYTLLWLTYSSPIATACQSTISNFTSIIVIVGLILTIVLIVAVVGILATSFGLIPDLEISDKVSLRTVLISVLIVAVLAIFIIFLIYMFEAGLCPAFGG